MASAEHCVPVTVIQSVLMDIIAHAAKRWIEETPGIEQTIGDAILHSPSRSLSFVACGFRLNITKEQP